MRAIVSVLDANDSFARILHVKDLDAIVVSHEQEGEPLWMVAWHLEDLEIERVCLVLWHAPGYLGSDQFFASIDHVKIFIILDANYELVGLVLYTT